MASIWQFVADMSSASPTVLFDLNDVANGIRVRTDWKLGPTLYEKGYAGGPLRHGKKPTRSSAINQILEIPIEINRSTATLAAQKIEDLVRQLAVDNFLKVQMDGGSPVFFRTFGDADFAAATRSVLIQDTSITLMIEAEPFAHGPRVEATGSPFTVSNDPAAATNPCRFDINGVLGDVPTPLLLLATSTGASNGLVSKTTHISTRRRGTPGNYSNLVQAEAMTITGADTTVVADAAFSGGSKTRTTFATTATLALRLNDTFPANGVSTVEARGEYIVYARVQKAGNATDGMTVQLRYGTSSTNNVANDEVTLPTTTNGAIWVNLGKVPVPMYSDPVTHGFSGVASKVLLAWVGIYASRFAGGGSLDIDCLYFMPADELSVITKFPATDTTYAIDGTTDEGGACYALTTALDEIISTAGPCQIVGCGFPEVIPGATNRIHMLRQVDAAPAGPDGIFNTTTVRAYYWPRWREFTRP